MHAPVRHAREVSLKVEFSGWLNFLDGINFRSPRTGIDRIHRLSPIRSAEIEIKIITRCCSIIKLDSAEERINFAICVSGSPDRGGERRREKSANGIVNTDDASSSDRSAGELKSGQGSLTSQFGHPDPADNFI